MWASRCLILPSYLARILLQWCNGHQFDANIETKHLYRSLAALIHEEWTSWRAIGRACIKFTGINKNVPFGWLIYNNIDSVFFSIHILYSNTFYSVIMFMISTPTYSNDPPKYSSQMIIRISNTVGTLKQCLLPWPLQWAWIMFQPIEPGSEAWSCYRKKKYCYSCASVLALIKVPSHPMSSNTHLSVLSMLHSQASGALNLDWHASKKARGVQMARRGFPIPEGNNATETLWFNIEIFKKYWIEIVARFIATSPN